MKPLCDYGETFAAMIDFNRAISTAWERMVIILFRPFDFGKWVTLAFVAFLAMLAEGSASINFPPYLTGGGAQAHYKSFPAFLHAMKEIPSWLGSYFTSPWLIVYVIAALFTLITWTVLTWVGCRGQFMLLDNIVRNRAALGIPWSRYAQQGNVWFLVRLITVLITFLVAAAVFLLVLGMNWPWIDAERTPRGGDVGLLLLSLVIGLAIFLVEGAILFFFHAMVLPLYFKQTMGLGKAISEVANLVVSKPGSMLIYLLVNFALSIAVGFAVLFIVLLSCCCLIGLTYVPFFGNLIMSALLCQLILPAVVFSRCFQLDCLAQFGPDYDVWTVDVPAASPAPLPPFTPQRPLE